MKNQTEDYSQNGNKVRNEGSLDNILPLTKTSEVMHVVQTSAENLQNQMWSQKRKAQAKAKSQIYDPNNAN